MEKRKKKEKALLFHECCARAVPQSAPSGTLLQKLRYCVRSSTRDTQHETAPGTLFHIQSQSQTHTPPFACARFYYSFLFLFFQLFAIPLLVACYLLLFTMCAQWFVLRVGDGWRLVGLGLMGYGVACPHFTRTYGCPGNRQPFCFGVWLFYLRVLLLFLLLLPLLLLSACCSSTR